jgi:hypothetical protein
MMIIYPVSSGLYSLFSARPNCKTISTLTLFQPEKSATAIIVSAQKENRPALILPDRSKQSRAVFQMQPISQYDCKLRICPRMAPRMLYTPLE